MNRSMVWLAGLFVFCLANAVTAADTDAIPLHVAVEKGLVDVRITGRGVCSGDAVEVQVTRKQGAGNILVNVTPGTVIETGRANVQSMALQKVHYVRVGDGDFKESDAIRLTNDDPHVCVLVGFCRDFRKDTPKKHDKFEVARISNDNATETERKILEQADKLDVSVKVTQAALWIHRDKVTDDDLKRSYKMTDDEIKISRKLLTAVENPRADIDVTIELKEFAKRIAEQIAERRKGKITIGDTVVAINDIEAPTAGLKNRTDKVKIAAGTEFKVVRVGRRAGTVWLDNPDGGRPLVVPTAELELVQDRDIIRRLERVGSVDLVGYDRVAVEVAAD